jgi:hypothetical protein
VIPASRQRNYLQSGLYVMVVVHLTQLTPTGGIDDFIKLRNLLYQALID